MEKLVRLEHSRESNVQSAKQLDGNKRRIEAGRRRCEEKVKQRGRQPRVENRSKSHPRAVPILADKDGAVLEQTREKVSRLD
jgi:hypothetical protein